MGKLTNGYLNVLTINKKTPENELVILDVNTDILYVQYIKGTYNNVVTTDGKVYYTSTQFHEIELYLNMFDYDYIARDTVVNMPKIKYFTSHNGRIYFVSDPSDKSLYVTANVNAYHKIEKWYDYKTYEAAEKETNKNSKGVFGWLT